MAGTRNRSRKGGRANKGRRLAYRTFDQAEEGAIIILDTEANAEEQERIHRALAESKTWDEFRHAMPSAEYRWIAKLMDEDATEAGKPKPKRSGPFDPQVIPGHSEGLYPSWSMQYLKNVIPSDLVEKYATYDGSMMMYLIFAKDWPELRRELEERGFELVERSDLENFR